MMSREGQREVKSGWMLLGAIVETVAGPYYFKFLGPEEVVRAGRGEFDLMIDSVGGGGAPAASASSSPAVLGPAP